MHLITEVSATGMNGVITEHTQHFYRCKIDGNWCDVTLEFTARQMVSKIHVSFHGIASVKGDQKSMKRAVRKLFREEYISAPIK